MDYWDTFNETRLPEKEAFHSNLNMEDLTDAGQVKVNIIICILNLIHYFWLMFLKTCFFKMCLKIYHLDPVKLLSAPGLTWQTALTKRPK